MKNKVLFLGSLCLILALGLVFVGCQNEVQTIELGSVSAPKNVVAVWEAEVKAPADDPHSARLRVTWDAVSANDVNGYTVVAAQEGSKNWISLNANIDIVIPNKISTTSGNTITYVNRYPDLDKYEAKMNQVQGSSLIGAVKIGVFANTRNTNHKKNSKVVWSKELVTIPAYTETF